MLKIYFGELEEAIYNTPVFFKNKYKREWLEDDFCKKMVNDIDKSNVIAGGVIDSPVFGLIPPERLSGGVKTLILMYKMPELIFNASQCGDNCAKWIVEISKKQDLTIRLGHFLDFGDLKFDAIVLNNNEKASNFEELFNIACKYI